MTSPDLIWVNPVPGRVGYLTPDRRTVRVCPVCRGRRWSFRGKPCSNCDGKGTIPLKQDESDGS